MNLLQGRLRVDGDRVHIVYGEGKIFDLSLAPPGPPRADAHGKEVILGVRPEHFTFAEDGSDQGIPVKVRFSEVLGSETLVHVDVPAPTVITEGLREIAQDIDDTVLSQLETARESRFVIKLGGDRPVGAGEDRYIVPNRDGRLYFFDPESPATPAWSPNRKEDDDE